MERRRGASDQLVNSWTEDEKKRCVLGASVRGSYYTVSFIVSSHPDDVSSVSRRVRC